MAVCKVLHILWLMDNGLADDWVPNNLGFTEDLMHSIPHNFASELGLTLY